ncbi:protein shifted isoform X3 [Frieseomelitta varia]|uniref:protein shifted isoform X3 n=1 Tax=Frieseomelitta varia TaxID=561572 RepID=UPI001CB68AEB|nr:protein shifted isoform X3 [Frieseomelitta varia]
MQWAAAALTSAAIALLLDTAAARHHHRSGNGHKPTGDISLWIDQQQIKMFSGVEMEIFAITEGRVLPYLLDPEFESKLPIIPSEVTYVNFTWKSGVKKYYYNFYRLKSFDETILKTPYITIKTQGRVPKRPKEPNPGPCPDGYLGPPHCKKALCYPNCMNGGNCTAPGVCSCPPGFQGPYCEGGICAEKCLNGGKCVQKDTCECPKGYFGLRCEFSKCVIPCLNGGKCKGNNVCRCPTGFKGDHCEIGRRSPQRSACTRACRNGTCQPDNTCLCEPGWFGKLCNKNKPWA